MNKIKIVIADDHAIVREGTRMMLEREDDMEVVGEARDGIEAIKQVERFMPDVAILDISMPKMSGIEATRQIKSRFPAVSVLILTAYDNDEYVFALLEAGAAGYLLKDVHGHEIVEAVRSVYEGESVLYPSIARKVIQKAVTGSTKSDESKSTIGLSERELEILKLVATGLNNKDIAVKLSISIRTVQGHLNSIFSKLSVNSRTEAIFQSVKRGWLVFDELS